MKTLKVPLLSNITKYWFDYNPSLTHFMSSLSVLFPDGERFFMKSMNAYRKDLPEYYVKELDEFCRQEASHGRIHETLNSHLDAGILKSLEGRTIHALDIASRLLNRRQRLVVTICLEHLTAILGERLLLKTDLTDRMIGSAKDIWLYHGQEELEHSHVAYDIYNYIGGGYLNRALMLPIVTIALAYIIVHNWIDIMNNDTDFGDDRLLESLSVLLGSDGFITEIIPEYMAWFRPGYHPVSLQRRVLG